MTSDKDSLFWNALNRSRRVRSPLIGCLLILLGTSVGTGVGYWSLVGPFADQGGDNADTPYWLKGEVGALCFGILTGFPFFLFAKRFFARDARSALRDRDGAVRPFVLYLRAFHDDAGWHGWFTEPRLGRVLRRVGVPVCVGRPGERLPPYGFHRIYFANEDWQQSVLTMAEHARVIVVLLGDTGGLAWEIRQLLERSWLTRTILLLPVRHHEQYRRQLADQLGINAPPMQEHYAPNISWRRFDLCPVEFPEPQQAGRAVMVVPTKASLPGPFRVLYLLFCLVILLLSFVIPWLRRFDWLGEERSLHLNYGDTLGPVLKRIDSSYSNRYWDRFL